MIAVLEYPKILITSVCVVFSCCAQVEAQGATSIRGGDRVKIAFFEHMEAPDTSSANSGAQSMRLLRTQYQRVDLSGEFVVDGDGMVAVPMLGSVRLAGSTPTLAANKLQLALKDLTGRAGIVSVAVTQRSPVYITGDVRSPGMFPFTPNMIVIQVVALAGGFDNGQLQPSVFLEALRSNRDQTIARERIRRLFARLSVLEMLRSDATEVVVPERLIQLSGEEGARNMIEAVRKVIQAREETYLKEYATRAEAVRGIRLELELLKGRISELDLKIKLLSDRARRIESLFARQVVEEQRVSTVLREQVDMEGHRNELNVLIVQTTYRLSYAEAELDQLKMKRRLEKEAEVLDIQSEIAQIGDTIDMTEATDSLVLDRSCCVTKSIRIEVIRSNLGVSEFLDATDTTPLEPGDVVRVSRTRQTRSTANLR